MDKPKLLLELYDYHGGKICPLYDSESSVSGQAYDVNIVTERNGWKELNFDLPAKMHTEDGEEDNFRMQMLKSDLRIRAEDEHEIDWYIVNTNKITHKAKSKDINVIAGHVSQLLKQKNMDLEFSDEYGNNVGTAADLLAAVLKGTGWSVGKVSDFLEDDGTIKHRSLKASSKTGAFKLVTMVADLFEAKPVFHGNERTVDLVPMNPFTKEDESYPVVDNNDVLELHYGVNVSNVTRDVNTANIATMLHVYGSYGDTTYGYCSIDECVHSIRRMVIIEQALNPGETYYFKLTDDSGTEIARHFTPERQIYMGDSLLFSFLDPASQMYVWDPDAETTVQNEETGEEEVKRGLPYVCFEGAEGTEMHYELVSVTPEWTEEDDVTSRTQVLSTINGEMHHWHFPDCDNQFRVEVYKINAETQEEELDISYTGENMKFDVGLKNDDTEQYYIRVTYRLSLVNYTAGEIAELKKKRDEIIKSCEARLGAQNWFNFLMDLDYFRKNGILTDDNVKTVAEFQMRAPEYYEQARNASMKMSEDIATLNKYVGTINFCKLAIAGADPTPHIDAEGTKRMRLRVDKSNEHPDGVIYRSDYYVTNKNNYFKWYGTPRLNADGWPESGIASVLYIIHDREYDDGVIKWDRAFLYDSREKDVSGLIESPDYLILHAAPDSIKIDITRDKFFLFQYLGTTGYLGAYESVDEAAVKTLNEVLKEATYEHPVYFGTVPPEKVNDEQNAVRTKTGDFISLDEFLSQREFVGQEYSWYWQYDEANIEPSKMYFCYKQAGDQDTDPVSGGTRGIYHYVHYQEEEPLSDCNERDYWFNFKKTKLYRFTEGEWVLLDSNAEKKVASYFGTVHQECMRKDMARNGVKEYYTYVVPDGEELPRGNYYMESGLGNAWITSTNRTLRGGDKLVYGRRENKIRQISGTSNMIINTKSVNLDSVSYHPDNLITEELSVGMINDEGVTDLEATDWSYTKAAMLCYPNIEYQVLGTAGYKYRIVEYKESNSNKRMQKMHDHQIGTEGETGKFTTAFDTTYLRICVNAPPETVNETLNVMIYATCRDRAFVTNNVNYLRLDNVTQSGDLAGVMPALSKFSEYADKVYDEDYSTLRSAQAEIDKLRNAMCEDLGDILREGHWQDNSYVDGDEAKLYKDALEKLKVIAQPEVKYTIKYNDNRYAQPDNDDWHVYDLTKNMEWPWITTQTAAHLLDPEIGIDVWAYVDKINRCYTDPKKTTISINTNLSTITQHTFGDVLANIASVANETRTSSRGGLKTLSEGIGKTDAAAVIYQQQQTANNDAISSTIAGMQTMINEIRDNYISATAISGYSTVEQTSDAITSTVASIQKEFNGGANLIKESNFYLYKTDQDYDITFYRLDLADEYSKDIFIGQYMTLSYYLESMGPRSALFGGNGQFDNYFGAGVSVIWGSRTNLEEDAVKDYMFDLCEIEGMGRRVSVTARIDPPEGNYDMIKDIWVSVQLGARPADGNENTWVFGQPQLEMGKFCTGYKESAFEIKAYSETMIRQTANEISAQIQALTDEYEKSVKVSFTEDGRVQIASSAETQKTIIDPDPYSHPVSQIAITSSLTVQPKEQQWRDEDEETNEETLRAKWQAANPDKRPYVWKRSVIINNGTIVRATQPECIDAVSSSHGSVLEVNDEYCYVDNELKRIHPDPGTATAGAKEDVRTTFNYLGDYTWSLTKLSAQAPSQNYYYFHKSTSKTMPSGINPGDTVYVKINKDELNDNIDVRLVFYKTLTATSGKGVNFVRSGKTVVPADTAKMSILLRCTSTAPVSDYKIGVEIYTRPPEDATWINEYRGVNPGKAVWSRTNITYNDGTTLTTDPVFTEFEGVRNTDIQYAELDRGTEPDGDTVWKIRISGIVEASKVVWTRTKYTYNDGTVYYTDPVQLRGSNIQEQQPKAAEVKTLYYNSDGETLTDAEMSNYNLWKEEGVVFETGKNMWSRNRITYTDGSVMWSTPQLCSATNALYTRDDLTISKIEIRYAVSNSWFVPPADTAQWEETLPTREGDNQYVWFSPWTWCRNGNIYRGLPVYITNETITEPTPMYQIVDGNDMPNQERGEWTPLNELTSYSVKAADKRLWIYVEYKGAENKTVNSDIARARYYDNLNDGGYDVHKSYEAMLNDGYIRQLRQTSYDTEGNTIANDVNIVNETATGMYRYLMSDKDAAVQEFSADKIYTKLESEGAIAEISARADRIEATVGGLSKNKIAHSDKIEVVDWEKPEGEADEPVECALSDTFLLDNMTQTIGNKVSGIASTATVRTTPIIQTKKGPRPHDVSLTTDANNLNFYIGRKNCKKTFTVENVVMEDQDPTNITNTKTIHMEINPFKFTTWTGATTRPEIFLQVNVYKADGVTELFMRDQIKVYYPGEATSSVPYDISYQVNSVDDYTTNLSVTVTVWSFKFINSFYGQTNNDLRFEGQISFIHQYEAVTGYTAEETVIGSAILNGNDYTDTTGYSISGKFNTEDIDISSVKLLMEPSDRSATKEYSLDTVLNEESGEGEETQNLNNVFSMTFQKTDFSANATYTFKLAAPNNNKEYNFEVSDIVFNRYSVSTVNNANGAISETLTKGSKYIISIEQGTMTNQKTGESDYMKSGIDIGIPKADGSDIKEMPFVKDSNGHPTGNAKKYEFIINSLEADGAIVAYAGKSGHTEGKMIQLTGVSVLKFPRYKTDGKAPYAYATNSTLGTGNPFILSIGSIKNNDYTYGGSLTEGKVMVRNKKLLENIAVTTTRCEVLRRPLNQTQYETFTYEVKGVTMNSYRELNISDDPQYFSFPTEKDYEYCVKLYANSPIEGNIKRGASISFRKVQLEEIDEKNEMDPETNTPLPTEWRPAIGEASPEFTNSAILINNDGIKATGGTIDIQAGSSFKVGSEGTVTINSASEDSSIRFGKERNVEEGVDNFGFQSSFEVTSKGEMYAKTGYFDELRVEGVPITPSLLLKYIDDRIDDAIREYFVRAVKPEGLPAYSTHGYYWMKPDEASLSGADMYENSVARSYTFQGERTITARGDGMCELTINAEPFPSIATSYKSVGYVISFTMGNATTDMPDNRSLFLNSARVYVEGMGVEGSSGEVKIYDKLFSPHYTIKRSQQINVELSTPIEPNMMCKGSAKFHVQLFLGNEKAYYDRELKASFTSGFNVTVKLPVLDRKINVNNVAALPYNVYYIPPLTGVVSGSDDSGEVTSEQSGSEQTGG